MYNRTDLSVDSVVRCLRGAMGRRKKGIPGLSFSWKRASGLSAAKGRLSRKVGVPLTKSGRQRKVGRAIGCCVPAAFILIGACGVVIGVAKAISGFFA